MRKRIIAKSPEIGTGPEGDWLDLETIAEVEITSEDPEHPIEHALMPVAGVSGWRAQESGEQTIRIIFSAPRKIRRIWVHFEEHDMERTQEFVLRWSPDEGRSFKEIVRQQWNFSPSGMREETENIYLDLAEVTVLELKITPQIGGGDAVASLGQLRVG